MIDGTRGCRTNPLNRTAGSGDHEQEHFGDERDRAIIRAMVDVASSMGRRTIAVVDGDVSHSWVYGLLWREWVSR